jgi:hypothetical protein
VLVCVCVCVCACVCLCFLSVYVDTRSLSAHLLQAEQAFITSILPNTGVKNVYIWIGLQRV